MMNGLLISDIEIKCNSNVPKECGGFPEMDDYKMVSVDVKEEY
jgi:hypothetical protein